KLPNVIEATRAKLDKALQWHTRQLADTKFRLKALAAQSFVPPHEHADMAECPLCASVLSSQEQRALAAELTELQKEADEAERKIEDVCHSLEADLLQQLPPELKRHRETLSAMDPQESYASAMLERFCEAPPFSDILIGLAGRLKAAVLQQKTT